MQDRPDIFEGTITVKDIIAILQKLPEDQQNMPVMRFDFEGGEFLPVSIAPKVQELAELEMPSRGIRDSDGNTMPNFFQLIPDSMFHLYKDHTIKEHQRKKVIIL